MHRAPMLSQHLPFRAPDAPGADVCCYGACAASATVRVEGDGYSWHTLPTPIVHRTKDGNEDALVVQSFEFCATHGALVAQRRTKRVVPGTPAETLHDETTNASACS
jgi:hypothetical protein